ncbi:ROK family protein [Brenneria tiliae]|uniref:ROK family protein n=1 Tax=Brenneria tiliae TaxID=2914984 RepID=A0ABT0MS07_9GAMM|nr:ROK family protein [Brenneria tiliae]MCL2892630.1 ROK family protein [Brenneria tiliae]
MDYKKQVLNILHSTSESRAEMTKKLGITKAYITKITASLIQAGLIEEREIKDISFGRPQQMLAVTPGRFFSVNMMLRQSGLQATLNDFNTTRPALAACSRPLTGLLSPAQLGDIIMETIDTLTEQAPAARENILTFSLALQGGIEQHTGLVRWCPIFNEENINLQALLEERIGIQSNIINIAHCTSYMLEKTRPGSASWIAFMPGFGSLGYGYCINGRLGLGDNGFYPEIVHLPYPGGIEQAFFVDDRNKEATLIKTADALYFAICCTAPIHNIKCVIVTGELFEDYGEEIIPLTQRLIIDNPNRHINTIRIHHIKAGYNYGTVGLVQISSDAITDRIIT